MDAKLHPIPSTMKSPRDRRPTIWRQGILQIWVTRACDKACVGCTQGSNLAGKPGFITVEQFRQACESLRDYFGVVGVFGGNPTMHPQFEQLCEVLREVIPYERRGLWCNNLRGKGAIARATFNPNVSNLNVHLDMRALEEFQKDWPEATRILGHDSDSRHSPPYVAMKDVIADEAERWRLIGGCDVNQLWSAMICVFRSELRGYFCELAGAQAMLHQDEPDYPDLGLPITAGWWDQPMSAFADQVRHHCHDCGIPLRGAGDLAVNGSVEQVSRTHSRIFIPKVKSRKVELVTLRSELGSVKLMTDYIGNGKNQRNVTRARTQVRRIDGLVACVNKNYADQLKRSLQLWLSTLNSVTVVTAPDDRYTLDMLSRFTGNPRLRIVQTPVFYDHGARFNKGAALNVAFADMQQLDLDWILNFDADIIPPSSWRTAADQLERHAMYGANRIYANGKPVPDWPFGCGFFQLWHIDDPVTQVRPIYDAHWGHAGNYDTTHLERWPDHRRLPIKIKVVHQGEPRQNWFGTNLNQAMQQQADRQMRELHETGLREVFVRGEGRVQVPAFGVCLCLELGEQEWLHRMLKVCTLPDPFIVSARVGVPKQGELFIAAGTTEAEITKMIVGATEGG